MKLLSWGSNAKGQLGFSDLDDVNHPKTVGEHDFMKILGGANHVLMLDSSFQLWGVGDAQIFGSSCPFELTRLASDVADFACGWTHSVTLSKNGNLNFHGKITNKQRCFQDETKVEHSSPDVVRVFSGPNAVFVLDTGHNLYQVIDGELFFVKDDVKEVACGFAHILIWTLDDKLEVLGKHIKLPDSLANILLIGSGWHHVVIVHQTLGTFQVTCAGRNTLGALGSSDRSSTQHTFNLDTRPVSLCVGSEYAMLLLEDGRLMTWGWNEHGNCGKKASEWEPPQVILENVAVIGCAYASSYALVK